MMYFSDSLNGASSIRFKSLSTPCELAILKRPAIWRTLSSPASVALRACSCSAISGFDGRSSCSRCMARCRSESAFI